jgi:hypothetical protein
MAYVSDQHQTIVQAPIKGIEKYTDADFKVGAPIMLVIVKSTNSLRIPNGSYVVRAQYEPRATSGKAIFTDSTGRIVSRQELNVRTLEQSAVLFPAIYSKLKTGGQGGGGATPVEIPNITSSHCFYNSTGPKQCWVDCTGWQPPRTLIFAATPDELEVNRFNPFLLARISHT